MGTIKKVKKSRRFGGELKVFVDYKNDPIEGRKKRNFEKAHLKAYIAGHQRFSFGKNELGQPIYFLVKQSFK